MTNPRIIAIVAVLVAARPERVPLALALVLTLVGDAGRPVDRRPPRRALVTYPVDGICYSLSPIIVKMPKHDAATAKSWMLQQPMVLYVGGAATARRRLTLVLSGAAAARRRRDGVSTVFFPP